MVLFSRLSGAARGPLIVFLGLHVLVLLCVPLSFFLGVGLFPTYAWTPTDADIAYEGLQKMLTLRWLQQVALFSLPFLVRLSLPLVDRVSGPVPLWKQASFVTLGAWFLQPGFKQGYATAFPVICLLALVVAERAALLVLAHLDPAGTDPPIEQEGA